MNDVFIEQGEITDKSAALTASVELQGVSGNDLEINIFADGKNVAGKSLKLNSPEVLKKENGVYLITLPFTISSPKLWWPNGQGEHPLYDITVDLLSNGSSIDKKTVKTGIKKIRLIRNTDKNGETFYFEVNGKPIFAKGANYIPNDVFPSRVDTAKYEYIVASAAQANMNMLRVWGGGIYENDLFYDLCDKYGILVWQDFMFACAMYPGNDDFLKEVASEANYNIKRLRNHPCISLWCGNNEIEQAWAQYEENRGWGWKQRYNSSERAIIWKAYDTVFHVILPQKVRELAPGIPYWHSSPSAGMGKLASHTNTSGDMHYWGVWHGNEPIESYKNYRARFMSEYGFQSFPEYESVKNYTKPEDWDIYSPVMLAHQRSMIGNKRINDYLAEWYNQPQSFEDFLYVSQLLQAEALKTAIHAHRTDRPYCMGTLYWQLNDCWPVASWSGIDYYGRWKALHYFAKEAFKNQIITVDQTNEKINIYGISDIDKTSEASLRINLMDFNGATLWNRIMTVKLNANSATLLTSIDLKKLPALQHKTDALISLSLFRGDKIIDTEIHYLDKPKNLKLPFPGLSLHIRQKPGKFDIEITSKSLCKNLMLISEGNAYAFPDNFFDILPGETKVVTVTTDLSYDEFEKKLSYIHLQQACTH
ncbi:MAG: beta-mannosidase [Chloroflexota bacterium]